MKKTLFIITALVGIFLFTTIPAGAASSENQKEQSISDRLRLLKELRELKESTGRGKPISNLINRLSTPPGLLRQKNTTQSGESASQKNRVYTGAVTSISASDRTFVLSTKNGAKTVKTTDDTRFLKGGLKGAKANFADLKVNDHIVAVGLVSGENLLTAKIVVITQQNNKQNQRRAVYGTVEQKSATGTGTLLTLRHPNTGKTFQVIVTGGTKITVKGIVNPTVNDIQIGNRVVAAGSVDETGKITAKLLHVIPGLARGLSGTQSQASPSDRGYVNRFGNRPFPGSK